MGTRTSVAAKRKTAAVRGRGRRMTSATYFFGTGEFDNAGIDYTLTKIP